MIEVKDEDRMTGDELKNALLDMVNAYRLRNIKLTVRNQELEDELESYRKSVN